MSGSKHLRKNKGKNSSSNVSVLRVIIGVVLGLVALAAGFFLIKFSIYFVTNVLPKVGESATQTALNMPDWLDSTVGLVLGQAATGTVESLVLSLAVFFILLFALGDIINQFSSFNEGISWIIAIGLALIAGVTKMVSIIVGWFGITAGIGAFGIGVIVIGAILTAVALNLILQWSGVKNAFEERADAEEVGEAAATMKKGFGKLKGASEMDEQ